MDERLADDEVQKLASKLAAAEIAGMRGVSERTVQRDWQKARLLLRYAMSDEA